MNRWSPAFIIGSDTETHVLVLTPCDDMAETVLIAMVQIKVEAYPGEAKKKPAAQGKKKGAAAGSKKQGAEASKKKQGSEEGGDKKDSPKTQAA